MGRCALHGFDAPEGNANKGKYDVEKLKKSRADYWDALDAAVSEDRQAHGKKPLQDKAHEPEVKDAKVSRTDPDAGYMAHEGKPKGFFYLDRRTVDARHAIIDSFATPASVHDSIMSATPGSDGLVRCWLPALPMPRPDG